MKEGDADPTSLVTYVEDLSVHPDFFCPPNGNAGVRPPGERRVH